MRRDGGAHPSPNAGPCEAAFAGALGVSLGGTNVYEGVAERRGTLGDGPPPGPADLDRAIRLSRLVTVAATVLCAAAAYLLSGRGLARHGAPAPDRMSPPLSRPALRPLAPTATFFGGRWRQQPLTKMPRAAAIGATGTVGTEVARTGAVGAR